MSGRTTPERQPRQQEPQSPGPDQGIQRRQPNAPRSQRRRRSERNDDETRRRERQEPINTDIDDAGRRGQTGGDIVSKHPTVEPLMSVPELKL